MTKISNLYGLTNYLTVDTTNGRIGINTAIPGYTLDVGGTARITGAITGTSAAFTSTVQTTNLYVGTTGTATSLNSIQSPYGILNGLIETNISSNSYYNAGWKYYSSAPAAVLNLDSGGNFAFYTVSSGTAGNNLNLTNAKVTFTNAGNVGIGTTTPSDKLHLHYGSGVAASLRLESSSSGQNSSIIHVSGGVIRWEVGTGISATTSYEVYDRTNSLSRFQITPAGNVGIGVAPATWATFNALEIGYAGNNIHTTGQNDLNLGSNIYYNGGYKYAGAGRANLLEMYNGEYYFHNAPSGTSGGGVTLTRAMSITNTGNVVIPNQAAWSVGRTTSQSFLTNVPSSINWDQSSGNDCFIQGGVTLNSSNGRITVPVAGKYLIVTSIRTEATGAATGTNINIRRNGTVILRLYVGTAMNSAGSYMNIEPRPVIISCAANDYIDCYFDSVTNDFSISATSNTVVRFGGHLIG